MERARQLVRQLLVFSQRQVLELAAVDLVATVAEFVAVLRRAVREDIELVVSCPEGSAHVLADPGQLHQVLMNLAVNAQEAMPDGGSLHFRVFEAAGEGDEAGADGAARALAIVRADDEAIDLLLSDVVMPRVDGKRLFELLSGVSPGLKVIYMSGYNEEVVSRRGVVEAGIHLLQKPFTVADLAREVRAVLDAGAGDRAP